VPYLTPETIPEGRACRALSIPLSSEWLAIVSGALTELTKTYNWEQAGSVTVDEAVAAMQAMLDAYYVGCAIETIDTPFWDDETDVDDELPVDEQPWYGYVTDATLPPDELTFIENAAIWALTGFLAIATPEIGFAPAILFHTIAPKFVLAMRRNDTAEILRILVDGQDAAEVDTTGYTEGDIINVPFVADPASTTGHDIMIIQVE